METLQLIKNFANITENTWLTAKLNLLEKEIDIKVLEAKRELLKELKN